MQKDKKYWQAYIIHGKACRRNYLKANLNGQYDDKIREIDVNLLAARKKMAACK